MLLKMTELVNESWTQLFNYWTQEVTDVTWNYAGGIRS